MKTASIVCIGNELLNTSVPDTNTAWLCRRLLAMGIPVTTSHIVGDDMKLIVQALERACEDADIVLVTGGLGPTDDDLTRQAFAAMLGVDLVLVPEALAQLEDFFRLRGYEMPQRNRIQACIPAGCQMLPNPVGTAPGILCQRGSKLLAAVPGVPSELEAIFNIHLAPQLKTLASGQIVKTRRLHCFGAGESLIAERIGDMMCRDRNPLINCTASLDYVTLYIIATAPDENQADQMIRKDEQQLRSLLGELIFGTDGETLAGVTGRRLTAAGQTLAVAESCTGGLLAKILTDAPGATDFFLQGWITYSNESKQAQLDVPADLLQQYGAVSPQVAEAMAIGARRNAGSDYALAITGIAGPDGGTEEKPVGLVYIALATPDECLVSRNLFWRGRDVIRLRAALTAIDMLRAKVQV